MPAEEVAESTPAETQPEAATPAVEPVDVSIFGPDEPKEAIAEPVEEPAPSETPSEPEKPEGESVSAPEAAKPSERSNAESRIKQLTAQIKALERKMAEQAQPPQQTQFIPEPKTPNLTEFETVEEYDKALVKYKEDFRKYSVEQDRQVRAQAQLQAEMQKRDTEARSVWEKRQAETLKRNPEFDARKFLEVVQPNATTDGFFVDSEVGPDLLDYLYQNPEEAERIREMHPYRAIRELVKLEGKISAQIKGIKSAVTVTPPAKVTGRAASPSRPKTAAEILYG